MNVAIFLHMTKCIGPALRQPPSARWSLARPWRWKWYVPPKHRFT
jgi:hypothetical protein